MCWHRCGCGWRPWRVGGWTAIEISLKIAARHKGPPPPYSHSYKSWAPLERVCTYKNCEWNNMVRVEGKKNQSCGGCHWEEGDKTTWKAFDSPPGEKEGRRLYGYKKGKGVASGGGDGTDFRSVSYGSRPPESAGNRGVLTSRCQTAGNLILWHSPLRRGGGRTTNALRITVTILFPLVPPVDMWNTGL